MKKKAPPVFARFILKSLVNDKFRNDLLDDFEEFYEEILKEKDKKSADKWYRIQVFKSLPGILYNNIYWTLMLFIYSLKLSIRNLVKHKLFSSLNIISFGIGFVSLFFITAFVYYEYSYDRFFPESEDIYRLHVQETGKEGEFTHIYVPQYLSFYLKNNFTEVEKSTFISEKKDLVVNIGKEIYYEKKSYQEVTTDYFDIFNISFLEKAKRNQEISPNSIYISESLADKYFGKQTALNKVIRFEKQDRIIKGVFRDLPDNTHLPPIKIVSVIQLNSDSVTVNSNARWVSSYVKLKKGFAKRGLERKINSKHGDEKIFFSFGQAENLHYEFFPVTDIHMKYGLQSDKKERNIFIFISIGVLILLLTYFNYFNLATANIFNRLKEIGIRKVIGAFRKQLFVQLLIESFCISIVAYLFSLIIFFTFLPFIDELTGKNISKFIFNSEIFFPFSFLLVLLTGLTAGILPSLFLTSFNPVKTIKGFINTEHFSGFRKTFIVIQFVISSFLITSAFTVLKQITYMKNADLGFTKNNMIVIPTQNSDMAGNFRGNIEILKKELRKIPDINGATAHLRAPGQMEHISDFVLEHSDNKNLKAVTLFSDGDFLNTYNIELSAGNYFDKTRKSNETYFIINNAALKKLGFKSSDNILGKRLSYWGGRGEIIGITKDFHFTSLEQEIKPLVIQMFSDFVPEAFTIQVSGNDLSKTLGSIKEVWKEFFPDNSFDYYFLEKDFNSQYKDIEVFQNLSFVFCLLAIIIAILGLIGLVILSVRKKYKEIGIRKVLGAETFEISYNLSKSFLFLITLAIVFSIPVSFYFIRNWLESFAYKITPGIEIFFGSAVLLFVVSLIFTFGISWKASLFNPADALREE